MPNAWPPLQFLVGEGVRKIGTDLAEQLWSSIACNWLNTMLLAFQKTQFMYEKYDALIPGRGGGEYTPQLGFGWTNGIMLDWMQKYANGILQCSTF